MKIPQEKIKTDLPHGLAAPLLATYIKEMKPMWNTDICTLMFRATLFAIGKVNVLKWMDRK